MINAKNLQAWKKPLEDATNKILFDRTIHEPQGQASEIHSQQWVRCIGRIQVTYHSLDLSFYLVSIFGDCMSIRWPEQCKNQQTRVCSFSSGILLIFIKTPILLITKIKLKIVKINKINQRGNLILWLDSLLHGPKIYTSKVLPWIKAKQNHSSIKQKL